MRESTLDVHVHDASIRANERNRASRRLQGIIHPVPDQPEVKPKPAQPHWSDWILPHKETRLMSEEAAKGGGVFIPYPLLGMFLVLVLALGGGIIGLYSQLSAMNTTMIMRDADYRREQQQSWEKIEQLQVYIKDDREKLVRLETLIEQQRRRN